MPGRSRRRACSATKRSGTAPCQKNFIPLQRQAAEGGELRVGRTQPWLREHEKSTSTSSSAHCGVTLAVQAIDSLEPNFLRSSGPEGIGSSSTRTLGPPARRVACSSSVLYSNSSGGDGASTLGAAVGNGAASEHVTKQVSRLTLTLTGSLLQLSQPAPINTRWNSNVCSIQAPMRARVLPLRGRESTHRRAQM
eukprot:scaffold61743_cov75-Phaeocystis_antarctica.AAC.2